MAHKSRALTARGARNFHKDRERFQIPAQAELERGTRKGRAERCNSASRAGFAQNDDKSPASKTEALFDSSSYGNARVVGGQGMCGAKYPQPASTVVEFECACVGDSERICHATGDGDLFVLESAGITVDGFNAYAMGASGKY